MCASVGIAVASKCRMFISFSVPAYLDSAIGKTLGVDPKPVAAAKLDNLLRTEGGADINIAYREVQQGVAYRAADGIERYTLVFYKLREAHKPFRKLETCQLHTAHLPSYMLSTLYTLFLRLSIAKTWQTELYYDIL